MTDPAAYKRLALTKAEAADLQADVIDQPEDLEFLRHYILGTKEGQKVFQRTVSLCQDAVNESYIETTLKNADAVAVLYEKHNLRNQSAKFKVKSLLGMACLFVHDDYVYLDLQCATRYGCMLLGAVQIWAHNNHKDWIKLHAIDPAINYWRNQGNFRFFKPLEGQAGEEYDIQRAADAVANVRITTAQQAIDHAGFYHLLTLLHERGFNKQPCANLFDCSIDGWEMWKDTLGGIPALQKLNATVQADLPPVVRAKHTKKKVSKNKPKSTKRTVRRTASRRVVRRTTSRRRYNLRPRK